MLSKKEDIILQTLQNLGLSEEECNIYLYLCQHGFVSALELSKRLPYKRTKIYRILDTLAEKHVISHELTDRGLKFGISSLESLMRIVETKKRELDELQHTVPKVISELQNVGIDTSPTAKIRMYRGKKGLEQVTYNSTKSKGPLRIYEARPTMETFLDHEIAEEMRRRMKEAGIMTLQLTNETEIQEYTDVFEEIELFWGVRYIDPEKLRFEFEVLIYDDIYCLYNVEGDDIFCVEIQDIRLAQMQKQLFDYLWSGAQELKIQNNRGKAVLIPS